MRSRFVKVLVGAVTGVVVLGGIYFLLVESGITRVRKVVVTGVEGAAAQRLRVAALEQSVLAIDEGALRSALGSKPPIKAIRVDTSFPDKATITVELFQPVAVVGTAGGDGIPVAADGTVLQGMPVEGLPRIEGVTLNGRVGSRAVLELVRAAGSAPPAFRGRIDSVSRDARNGVTLQLSRGPAVHFGSTSGLRAKWAALIRVLSDPASVGASYIDVRVPRRPAIGGVPGGVQGGIDPADPTQAVDPGGAAPGQADGSPAPGGGAGPTGAGGGTAGGAAPTGAAGGGGVAPIP